MANITCSNCGMEFESTAKRCPFCGAKNYMKICDICGAQMTKGAKQCPVCGAKNRKPLYQQWWFWVLILLLLFCVSWSVLGGNILKNNPTENTVDTGKESLTSTQDSEQEAIDQDVLVGDWEIYKMVDMEDTSQLYEVDEVLVRFHFRDDGTGTIEIDTEEKPLPITWSFIADQDGYRMYSLNDGSGEKANIMYIPSDAEEVHFRGMLYYATDDWGAFFKKTL